MPQRRLCAASLSAALQPAGGPLRQQLPCFGYLGAFPRRGAPYAPAALRFFLTRAPQPPQARPPTRRG